MRHLLSDYGLVWLGDAHATRSHTQSSAASSRRGTQYHRGGSDPHSPANREPVDQRHATVCKSHALQGSSAWTEGERCSADDSACADGAASRHDAAVEASSSAIVTSRQAQKLLARPKRPDWVAECARHLSAGVAELNNAAAPTRSHLVSTPWSVSAGKGASEVRLVIWADGLQLHQQSLARWDSSACSSMLRDILEGAPRSLTRLQEVSF
jgi:hypothetical protein